MSILFRIILIIFSFFTLCYMLKKIRHSKLQIEYALFWVLFVGLIVVLSIFPEIAIWLSEMLGLYSPTNLIFLVIIFVLVVKLFQLTLDISKLDDKVKKMTQVEAIKENDVTKNKDTKQNGEK